MLEFSEEKEIDVNLPDLLIRQIVSYLANHDLLKIITVNKIWHKIISEEIKSRLFCVTVITWPPTRSSHIRKENQGSHLDFPSEGHSALKTYSGGPTGNGVYVSFWPGHCREWNKIHIERYLISLTYPVDKEEIINYARTNKVFPKEKAPRALSLLRKFQEKTYENVTDIVNEEDRLADPNRCYKTVSHFHTIEHDDLAKQDVLKTEVDIYGLDITSINHEFPQMHDNEMHSVQPWRVGYNCSNVVLTLLESGGLDELVKRDALYSNAHDNMFKGFLYATKFAGSITDVPLQFYSLYQQWKLGKSALQGEVNFSSFLKLITLPLLQMPHVTFLFSPFLAATLQLASQFYTVAGSGEIVRKLTVTTPNDVTTLAQLTHSGENRKSIHSAKENLSKISEKQSNDDTPNEDEGSLSNGNKIDNAGNQASTIHHTREGKEISAIYWYEDSEMSRILAFTLSQHSFQTSNGHPVQILGPLDNISPFGLTEALLAYRRQPGIVLIPFNLGCLHWVGLILEYDTNQNLIRADYYDPQGNNIPPFLNEILRDHSQSSNSITAFTKIQDNTGLIRQINGSDCGPCTIANLLAGIGYSEPPDTDSIGRRLRDLQTLEIAGDNIFYTDFYQRQRLNQSSFSYEKTKAPHSTKSVDEQSRLGISEYTALLRLALSIHNIPIEIQNNLKEALQLEDDEAHASQLDRIRTVLNEHVNNSSIRIVIKQIFYLEKNATSLASTPLKLDFNQILPLFTLLSLSKEELETNYHAINKSIPETSPSIQDIDTLPHVNVEDSFSQLENIICHHLQQTQKLKLNLVVVQLHRNLVRINQELQNIKNEKCSMQKGLENIIAFSQKIGEQHPIIKVAEKCHELLIMVQPMPTLTLAH